MFNEHKKILAQLRRFEAKVPKMVSEMGGIALNHFTRSFTNQGFTDNSLQKWKPRERTRYKTRSGKSVDDTTRGILIGKGTAQLMKLSRVNIGRYAVAIRNNAATSRYARVHNEGLRAGRGKGFQMPKRQFVGFSGVMNRKIIAMINKEMGQI
jgi:phage gpG-like protein